MVVFNVRDETSLNDTALARLSLYRYITGSNWITGSNAVY